MKPFRFYNDRPLEFWSVMGPMFADAKLRRELPYLCDRAGLIWMTSTDAVCSGFCCFEHTGNVATVREIWAAAKPGTLSPNERAMMDTLIAYWRATGVERAGATLKGRSLVIAERAGFMRIGARGAYSVLEMIL